MERDPEPEPANDAEEDADDLPALPFTGALIPALSTDNRGL